MSERDCVGEIRARYEASWYDGRAARLARASADIAYLLDRVDALEKRVESLRHGWKDE